MHRLAGGIGTRLKSHRPRRPPPPRAHGSRLFPRQLSHAYLHPLVHPVAVFAILAFVVVNAMVAAPILAFIWIAVGVVVLLIFRALNREPALAGLEEE